MRKLLTNERLDAFISVVIEDNNKNVYYLSGFGGTTGALAVGKNKAVLAVDARYTARAMKEARGARTVAIPPDVRRSVDFAHYVETAVSNLKLRRGARIGFEGARVSTLMQRAWEKRLGVRLVPTRGIVEGLRQIKDTEELTHLARAGKITSDVFVAVSKKIRPGLRESDVAALLDIELRKRGALGASFKAIVASGKNSAIPHHETSERKMRAGEPLVVDFGGVFPGGYCSDLTRTIFVPGKKPNQKLWEMYAVVLSANKKALSILKPGIMWKEYDDAARSYITEHGYGKYFTHGLGHSIGLEVHDPFNYQHDAIREGAVLSNEPGIYMEGIGGIRIEDDVAVTKKGAKKFTHAPYLTP